MKENHIFRSNARVHIKEINQWGDPNFWPNGSTFLLKGNKGVESVQNFILLFLSLV